MLVVRPEPLESAMPTGYDVAARTDSSKSREGFTYPEGCIPRHCGVRQKLVSVRGNSVGVECRFGRNNEAWRGPCSLVTHATSGNRLWPSILLTIVPLRTSTTKTCPSSIPTASQGFSDAGDAE